MSLSFSANTQYARITAADSDNLLHTAYSVTFKIKVTSDAAGTAIAFDTKNMHFSKLYTSTNGTSWLFSRNYGTGVAVHTGVLNDWMDVAVTFGVGGSNPARLRVYMRNPGGATTTYEVEYAQFVDEVYKTWVGSNGESGKYLRGLVADFKAWRAELTQAEVEAEWAALDNVRTTDYIGRNDFAGANIGEAFSSTESNETWFDTWTNLNFSDAAGADPGVSADVPTYVGAAPSLSGTVAMPSTSPSLGVDVVAFRSVSIQGAASAAITYTTAPTSDRLLVACVGGYTTASAVTISDNRSGTWTQRVFAEGESTAADIVVGFWTANVPSGSGPYTITATPVGDANNFITLTVLEVTKHYAPSPIDVVSVASRGSGTSVAIDIPPTVSAKTLVLSIASWFNSETFAAAGGSNTEVAQKSGQAGLVVAKRYVSSAGNYDGAFTLNQSDAWVGVGLAITEDQGTVGGGMPPILRNKRRRGKR